MLIVIYRFLTAIIVIFNAIIRGSITPSLWYAHNTFIIPSHTIDIQFIILKTRQGSRTNNEEEEEAKMLNTRDILARSCT